MTYLFGAIKTQPSSNWYHEKNTPIHHSNQQTVERLRRQNQYLKQKLDTLIKVVPPQIRAIQSLGLFCGGNCNQLLTRNKSQYDDRPRRNNYCRCNNGQANKGVNSPRGLNQQLFNSPNPFTKGSSPQYKKMDFKPREGPLFITDPRVKMMVISKGKDGRYFRDHQIQNKIIECRSLQASPNRLTPNTSRMHSPHPSNKIYNPNLPKNAEYKVEENRIRFNSPSFLHSPSKINRYQHKQNNNYNENGYIRICSPKIPAQFKKKESRKPFHEYHGRNNTNDFAQLCQSIVAPQKAYVFQNKDWIKDVKRCQSRHVTYQFSEGDSKLSIEQHMREERQNNLLNNKMYIIDSL